MTARRTTTRRRRVVALLVLLAALAAVRSFGAAESLPSIAAWSPTATPPALSVREEVPTGSSAVPDGTTVFDDDVAGVANLDPDLLDALRAAADDAAHTGVELLVDSGWRSPQYQARLLEEAVAKYGSAAEAARWVATPERSAHVSGDAVDIGPASAAAWLSAHGAAYGLCQIYRNEPWHYELRPDAVDAGCPAMYADPTHDPRMHS